MNLFNGNGRRARLIGTALLLVTFVAGGLAGAASERVMRADDPPPQPQPTTEKRGETRRLLLDDEFVRRLELTADQQVQMKTIMDRRDQQARAVWKEVEPRFKAVSAATRAEIEKILTPEQQEKLEAEIVRRRAEWKERGKCARDSAKT